MDSFVCNKCKYETFIQDEMFMHQCPILEFKPKEKSHHEKQTELIESSNYLIIYFNQYGQLAYRFGEGMTDEQLVYINKVIDIITTDTIKSNTEMRPNDIG